MSSKYIFFIFMAFQLYLFGLNGIPTGIAKGLALLTLVMAIVYSKYKEIYYSKQLKLFFLFCMVNMIWCTLHRAQSPIEYIIGNEFTNIIEILVLFAIPAFNLSNEQIERCLLGIGFFCVGLYLAQYLLHIPLTVDQEVVNNAGMDLRVRINGQCIFFLLYFKSLANIVERMKIRDLLIILSSLLCIFIMGFRSQIVVLALVSILFIWRKNKISGKMFFGAIVLIGILAVASQTEIVQHKIDQMVERNEKDNFDNEDYARLLSYDYYTNQYPENLGDKILGGGLPNGNSTYGAEIQDLKGYHIIWADWGLIGLSWVLGIPTVLCLVWLFFHAFITPVEPDKSYLCYWCLFMVLGSILTREIYRVGAFPIEAVVLYLIAQYRTADASYSLKNIRKR